MLCFQDETPLFLAAREGSFETAKILLDHYANRDITDHMDRLPRDVAQERLHKDIVHLLDEYRMNSPANMALNGMPTSPNHLQFMQAKHSNKKRRKNGQNTPISPTGKAVNGVHQKKPKTKKKSSKSSSNGNSQSSEGSSVGTVSPGNSIESPPMRFERTPPSYDAALYTNGNHYGLQLMEEVATIPQGCMDDQRAMMAGHYDGSPRMDQSELLWHQAPHSQPQNIPPHAASLTTPSSNMTSNPSPMGHGKMSPAKPGKNLPTSPTHIQAMQQRALQERNHGSPLNRQNEGYSFPSKTHVDGTIALTTFRPQDTYQVQKHPSQQVGHPQQMYQYPTPPSQHSMGSPPQNFHSAAVLEHYLTPSPDSPGQWSSSSPHSANSNWSEGIPSPDNQPIQRGTNAPVYL